MPPMPSAITTIANTTLPLASYYAANTLSYWPQATGYAITPRQLGHISRLLAITGQPGTTPLFHY
jgi:hypothetical protein